MESNKWQLQDAKSKFSQLVESAMHNRPQFVTKHGRNAVAVLSFEEYKKITKPESDLVTFLRNSPLVDIDLDTTKCTRDIQEMSLHKENIMGRRVLD